MMEAKEMTGEDVRKIENKMDCRTVGAIYGINCKKCEKNIYVGKPQNRALPMDRFIGYRAHLRGEDET